MMLVQEAQVNATEGYRFGESPPYEAFSDDVGELFRHARGEFGRCTGSVYLDLPEGKAQRVGWVFQKAERYTDTGQSYLHETWVTLHRQEPAKLVTYHYVDLDSEEGHAEGSQ